MSELQYQWALVYGDEEGKKIPTSEERAKKKADKRFGDKVLRRTVIPAQYGEWEEVDY